MVVIAEMVYLKTSKVLGYRGLEIMYSTIETSHPMSCVIMILKFTTTIHFIETKTWTWNGTSGS